MTLLEPDVALTDFALAVACAGFAAWLQFWSISRSPLRAPFAAFFAAVGLAALLGGITHGFLSDQWSVLYGTVWSSTLIAIGIAACASWIIGARLILPDSTARRVAVFAGSMLALYAVIILFVSRSFAIAIAHYIPAAVFLLIVFILAYRRRPTSFLMAGIAGVALTFVAAAIQQGGVGLHRTYFNHNALYHVVQGIALLLIFLAARGLLRS
jgi:hypothetical protein